MSNDDGGAMAVYTFEIMTSDTGNGGDYGIPKNGWIFVNFASEFDLSNIEIAQTVPPGMTGGFDSVKVEDNKVMLRRDGTGNDVNKNRTVSFKVGNIINPPPDMYTIIVETKTNTKTTIDHGTYNSLDIQIGPLDYIKIESASSGMGEEIGDKIVTTDENITMYAVGYDAFDNFVANIPVNWTVSGAIGTVLPTNSTSTTLMLTTIGSGKVTADDGSGHIDYTGNITVNPGSLHRVKVIEGANGNGDELTTRAITTDQTLTIHAAGFDFDNNYIGDLLVTWLVTNSIGQFQPNPGASTVFNANQIGTGRIRADHATAIDDETDDITVSIGALNYIKIVTGASGNGAEYTTGTISAGQSFQIHAAGYDADANYISDVAVDWSVINGIGTVNPSLNSIFTNFTGTTAGIGLIKADHTTDLDDYTDEITVTSGPLHYLSLRTGPNGSGRMLTGVDTSLFINQSLNLYAAGYDQYNNFVRDVFASWDTLKTSMNQPSTLDYPDVMVGTNIQYHPKTAGSYGRFRADSTNILPAISGNINIYDISYIKINSTPGSNGVEFANHVMTTDDSIKLYAAAYDAMNNYLDTTSVIWVADIYDSTISDTSASFVFSPVFAPDTLKIYCYHPSLAEDSTGVIIIKAGFPSGIFQLLPDVNELSANGTDLTRITSDIIYDNENNKISSDELFTISYLPKNLGLSYGGTYLDQDLNRAGHQVLSDQQGKIVFEIQSGTVGGSAFITATSINGTAYGDTIIFLSSIRILNIDIDKDKVSQGQDSVEVRMLIENNGPYDVSALNADLTFIGTGNIKRNNFYEVIWDSIDVVLSGQQKTLAFMVNIANGAPPEIVTIDGRISGLANGLLSVADSSATLTDAWLVQKPSELRILTVAAPKDTVERGTNASVYLTIENIGDADAIVLEDSVKFYLNDPPFTEVTNEYKQVSIPSRLDTIYAGEPAITLSKSITVGANATEGSIRLDSKIIFKDINSESLIVEEFTESSDQWFVQKKGEISIVDFFHNQQSVILGQKTPWYVTMKVQNNFDTTDVKLDSARLEFFAGTDNITSEFVILNPTRFEEFSKIDTLYADTTETLVFSVNETSEITSGRVRIIGTAYLSDIAQTQLIASAEDQINIQSAADLLITSVTSTMNEVTIGQQKDWQVRAVVKNTGLNDIIIDFSSDSTYLKFSTGSDFKIVKPLKLEVAGDSLIHGSAIDTIYFIIDSTGHTSGESNLTVQLKYLDINALGDPLYARNTNAKINVETPPRLRVLRTVNIAPNTPFVNTNQNFLIRVDIENSGDDGVHNVTLLLNSDSTSVITPLNPFYIAGNCIDSVYFNIRADDNWNLKEVFSATIDTALGENTTEFDSLIIAAAVDDTTIARIQYPAIIEIVEIIPSNNPVQALSKNWSVTINVNRIGAGAVLFYPPHKDSLKFYINGVQQTDYFITAPLSLRDTTGFLLSGWDPIQDAFVFTIDQAGLIGGEVTISATLTGRYLNNGSTFVVKSTGNLTVETTAAIRITKTEPICLHIDDGVGILSTEQQFKIRVTFNNSGEEPVDSIWISLLSDDPVNYPKRSIMSDSILSNEQKSIDFSILAKLDEQHVEFTAQIDSAKSRFSGGSALIGIPYDSIAICQIQQKANLSLSIHQADSVMTLGENSSLRYIVQNSGTAATESNGKVTISLPPNYKIKVGSSEQSGNVIDNFIVNRWDTLKIVPPAAVSENDEISMIISQIPKDINTGYGASADPYFDSIIVKTVPSDLTMDTQLSWPLGVADNTVSTEQFFDIQSTLNYSDNVKTLTATLRLPEEYSLNSGEQETKAVTSNIVKWRVQAPALAHTFGKNLIVDALGKVNGVNYPKSDTITIVTVKRSELHLENVGIVEPIETDSTLSIGQGIKISATVNNFGAPVIGQGSLIINFGATGVSTEEDTIKQFTVGTPVTWIATAPTSITSRDKITISMMNIPQDENSNTTSYAPGNSKFFYVSTVEGGEIQIENFRIYQPVGAFDRIISTNQYFTLQAELNWHNCIDKPTVSIELPDGFTTPVKDKYPIGTSNYGTVSWEIKAPSESVSNINIWVESIANDQNSGQEIKQISESIVFDVVRQAEISLNAEIENNTSGIVTINQNFTVMASVIQSGGDAAIEDYYSVSLTLPLGEGYTTQESLTKRVLHNQAVSWLIKSPLTNRETKNFIVNLTEAPHDENTNNEIEGDAIINDLVYLWIKTEDKSVNITTLPKRANTSVSKGDSSIPMLGLQFDCSGNEASSKVLLKSIRVKLKDKSGRVIENPQDVINKIAVIKYMNYSEVYGVLTEIPASDSIFINFSKIDTLLPGVANKIEFLVDIAENAKFADFQVTIDSSSFFEMTELGSTQKPKLIFNGESSAEFEITSGFSNIVPRNFAKAFWNYPNPFGSSDKRTTTIQYLLDEDTDVELRIYTLLGELVWSKRYSKDEPQGKKGMHDGDFTWDATNSSGHKVLNGVYAAVLSTSYGKSATTKIAVLK